MSAGVMLEFTGPCRCKVPVRSGLSNGTDTVWSPCCYVCGGRIAAPHQPPTEEGKP